MALAESTTQTHRAWKIETFSIHCNVEYCNSVKSTKFVYKYVNKWNDSVWHCRSECKRRGYEISTWTLRELHCNEAIWRLFSFPIHDRHPTIVHLAVHLENDQRVYFTEANAVQRAERPPATTLTNFFSTCESDPFASTLL